MRVFFSILTLIISLIQVLGCSVDYSILEDRYCNTSDECIKGYVCDLNSRKCIKEGSIDTGWDTKPQDIQDKDIIITKDADLKDVQDSYYYDTHYNPDVISDIISDVYQCETGTYSCNSKDLYKCDENNQWVFEKTCDLDCINGHCTECTPKESICLDEKTIKICTEEGLYRTENCFYKCYDKQCVICVPEEKYCDKNTAVVCDPNKLQWERTECQIGCAEGECMVCEPLKSYQCQGNDLYVCAQNGLTYTLLQNCCHENNCSETGCIKTGPRVIDYSPKDWKVFSKVNFIIDGCFFVKDASRVLIDFGGSWKEITEYKNFKYIQRLENRIQIEVDVQTASEYNFKVQNPDGQETSTYPIKKHF